MHTRLNPHGSDFLPFDRFNDPDKDRPLVLLLGNVEITSQPSRIVV